MTYIRAFRVFRNRWGGSVVGQKPRRVTCRFGHYDAELKKRQLGFGDLFFAIRQKQKGKRCERTHGTRTRTRPVFFHVHFVSRCFFPSAFYFRVLLSTTALLCIAAFSEKNVAGFVSLAPSLYSSHTDWYTLKTVVLLLV